MSKALSCWFALSFSALAACSASPKINVGNEPDGSVAGVGGASGSSGLGGFGGGDNTLTALITEPPSTMAIEVVTISCAGECKQVLAIASGGNPGYTFEWNDGVTTAAREICADDDTTFTVTVVDTEIIDGEFPYEAQTAIASATANVLACPADAGVDAAVDAGDCELAPNLGFSAELTPDIFGAPSRFADGAALPAGRYRIAYVDGCIRYQGLWPWSVNGTGDTYEFVLIGDTTTATIAMVPGTEIGFLGATGGYAMFEECVAANRALPPLDIDFAGGPLGIFQNDFQPQDNVPGENGRNPTWRLTRICQ